MLFLECCKSGIVYICIILLTKYIVNEILFHGKLYQWNITKPNKVKFEDSFLPNLNVDTSNANWEVRDMIFPGSGKERAN